MQIQFTTPMLIITIKQINSTAFNQINLNIPYLKACNAKNKKYNKDYH